MSSTESPGGPRAAVAGAQNPGGGVLHHKHQLSAVISGVGVTPVRCLLGPCLMGEVVGGGHCEPCMVLPKVPVCWLWGDAAS